MNIMEIKEPRAQPKAMARINTRIRHDQQKYIKTLAKRTKRTEGEIFRYILDEAMKLNK